MCEELVKDLDFNRDSEYPKLDNWTILIPSKNRLDKEITYKLLAKQGILDRVPTYLVVEPQEYEEAQKKGFRCISLDKNDQGMLYCRNWMIRYAQENNLEHVCILDDDLKNIGIIDPDPDKPGKYKRYVSDSNGNKRCYLEFLLKTAERLDGMACIPYAPFADHFYETKLKKEPSGIDICGYFYQVLLYNMKYMPKNFQIRDDGTIDDAEQLIQLTLENKVKIYKIYKYYFSSVPCGSNTGGMNSLKLHDKYDIWLENAKKLYGDLVRLDDSTIYKFRIDSRLLSKRMKKQFSEMDSKVTELDTINIIL